MTVVVAPTAEVLTAYPQSVDLLSPTESQRAGRFRRASDRDDFVAAHVLLRHCAGRLLGLAPAAVRVEQRCLRCGGPHGRPVLPAYPWLAVSLAHTAGWVAAAAGDERIGVDLESRRTTIDLRLSHLEAVLGPAELAWLKPTQPGAHERFLQLWVRKEAAVKAGLADLDTLAEVEVVVEDQLAARLAGLTLTGWEDTDVLGACLSVSPPSIEPFDLPSDA